MKITMNPLLDPTHFGAFPMQLKSHLLHPQFCNNQPLICDDGMIIKVLRLHTFNYNCILHTTDLLTPIMHLSRMHPIPNSVG